jgi:hypothetical protein
MSYNGYTQAICKDGHYHTYNWFDVDECSLCGDLEVACPYCGECATWCNDVETDNGANKGFISESDLTCWMKDEEGNSIYRIPTKEETIILRNKGVQNV